MEAGAPNGRVALYTSAGINNYHHMDWLGSYRLESNTGRGFAWDTAYGPFGEPYAASGSAVPAFTGMTQDTASNVYDFPAREYGIQGRRPSPDPAGLAAVNPMDPQTWNRYAYVRNSPLELIDPFGLCGGPDRPGTQGSVEVIGDPPCPPEPIDAPLPCDPEASLCSGAGSGGGGAQAPPPSTAKKVLIVLNCASETANKASLAGLFGLNNKQGFWGAAGKGLLGNTFSGVYDTTAHMAQVLSAQNSRQRAGALLRVQGDLVSGGASQGLPIGATGVLGNGVGGTLTDAAANTAVKAVPGVEGALTGAGTTAADVIGWAKVAVDGAIFLGSAVVCTVK